jgi:formate-dependent nitrite reductase membrane component NrfD
MTAVIALAQFAVNPQSGIANPPHWGWYVVLYFFLGGLAGGCYFIASLLALLGDPRDRPTIRLGYLIAFPLVVVCGILLIIDLGMPLRFWHMLIQSEHAPKLMFKPWSPISVGSWVLMAFGFFAFVSFVGAMVEAGRIRHPFLVRLDERARAAPRPLAVVWGVLGAFFGFFLAGYTGVLVTGSGEAVWHNAQLLGALFLISAASTSYALLLFLLLRRGVSWEDPTLVKLARADRWAIALEILVLTIMLVGLGSLARPFITGGFGIVFWIGVVVIGLVAPLVLHGRAHRPDGAGRTGDALRSQKLAATCVLVGGLLLRFVIVMSPQWPKVKPWYL